MEKLEFGRKLKDTLMGEARAGRGYFRGKDGQLHSVEVLIKSFEKKCVLAGKTRDGKEKQNNSKRKKKRRRKHRNRTDFLIIASIVYFLFSLGTPVAENPKNELSVQARLSNGNSPYICRLLDVKDGGDSILAILEYCSGGELFSLLHSSGPSFTIIHASTYFIQLLLGLQYIHSHHIVHRDLSLENLLLTQDSNLRIADFGLSLAWEENQLMMEKSPIGKIRYISPELFSSIPYNPYKSDIWAAGVIFFLMLFRVFPWNFPHKSDPLFVLFVSGKINSVLNAWKKPSVNEELENLFSGIFCPEEKRFTIEQLLNHPYLKEAWKNNGRHVEESRMANDDQKSGKMEENPATSCSIAAMAGSSFAYGGSLDSSDCLMRNIENPASSARSSQGLSSPGSSALFPTEFDSVELSAIPAPTPFNAENSPHKSPEKSETL